MKDLSHLDASWTNVDPCIWSIVENGVGKSAYKSILPTYPTLATRTSSRILISMNREGIISTCLPTLRPLYSIAVRGHYCRSNEYCARCSGASRKSSGDKSMTIWNSASTGASQSIERANVPGAMLEGGSKGCDDVENQLRMLDRDGKPIQVFSIMDRPL